MAAYRYPSSSAVSPPTKVTIHRFSIVIPVKFLANKGRAHPSPDTLSGAGAVASPRRCTPATLQSASASVGAIYKLKEDWREATEHAKHLRHRLHRFQWREAAE